MNLKGGRGWIFSAAQLTAKRKLSGVFDALVELQDDEHQHQQQQQQQQQQSAVCNFREATSSSPSVTGSEIQRTAVVQSHWPLQLS